MLKSSRYFLESVIVKMGLLLFKAAGVNKASNAGSSLARFIGKLLSVNKLAIKNIKIAFPDLEKSEINSIIDGMWDNLGRIVGEFTHICHFSKKELAKHVEVDKKSASNLEYIKKNCRGGIIFSAHIGNWEVGPKFFLNNGLNVKTVYRPLNNRKVDEITSLSRGVEMIPKSSKGGKQIIKEIKDGNYVIILVDQKISEGVEIPFFGQKAATSVSIAKLALRYGVPLIPVRVVRLGKKFKFKMEVEKPIETGKLSGANEDAVKKLMTKINKKLEGWIKEYPAQWFWVHNRWKK